MAQMSRYCKAYPAADLRRFPEWREQCPPLVVQAEGGAAGAGESESESWQIFFVHDDFVVTAGMHRDEQVAFDQVTDAWKTFCRNTLQFEAPVAGD